MLFLFPLISSPTLPLVSNYPWNGSPHWLSRPIHVKSHLKPDWDQEMTPSPACLCPQRHGVVVQWAPCLSFKPVSMALWFWDFSQDTMLLSVSLLPLHQTGKWWLLSTLLNPMSSLLGSLNILMGLFLLLLYSHCQFCKLTANVRAGWQSVTGKRSRYQTAKVL